MTEIATCPKCRNGLREGAKFCRQCGTEITLFGTEFAAQVDILKKRIERDSLNPKLYIELGNVYWECNLLQEALVEYQKAVNIDSSIFDANLKSGEIYLAFKEFEKAIISFEKASALNPESFEVQLGLFRAYHASGKIDRAIKLGEIIIGTDPKNLDTHKALKEMYAKSGMNEKVFCELEIITSLAPNEKEPLKELAQFYTKKNEQEKSLRYYRKILELDPKDVEAGFAIGESYCLQRNFEKTIESLRDITKQLPSELESFAHLYLALGYINLTERLPRGLESAIDEIKSVEIWRIEKTLTDEDKKLLAETYFKIGYAVLSNKNLSSAIGYMEKAVHFAPQNLEYKRQLDTIKEEQAELDRKATSKTRVIVVSTVAVGIIAIVGWYLSHGKIRLEIAPAEGATTILVDGALVQVTYGENTGVVFSPSLLFGSYKVTIQKDGYKRWESKVSLGWGKTASIKANLAPIYGSLKINSEPLGADVYVDSKYVGKTPISLSDVLAASHSVEIKKEGWKTSDTSIIVQQNEQFHLKNIHLKGNRSIYLYERGPYVPKYFIGGKVFEGSGVVKNVPPEKLEVRVWNNYVDRWSGNTVIDLKENELAVVESDLTDINQIYYNLDNFGFLQSTQNVFDYELLSVEQSRKESESIQSSDSYVGAEPIISSHKVATNKTNFFKNRDFERDFDNEWIKDVDWSPESNGKTGANKVQIEEFQGSKALHIDHSGWSKIRVSQRVTVNNLKLRFSAKFKLYAHTEWSSCWGSVSIRLILEDASQRKLGQIVWAIGHTAAWQYYKDDEFGDTPTQRWMLWKHIDGNDGTSEWQKWTVDFDEVNPIFNRKYLADVNENLIKSVRLEMACWGYNPCARSEIWIDDIELTEK